MSKEIAITDRRLLAALDYIDQKYIDDVFSILKEPEAAGEPEKMTWRTPFKHWRQFAALAACILLLSIASPLVNYIAEVISNFNAGAGSGTTEATTQAGEESSPKEEKSEAQTTIEESNRLTEIFKDSKILSFPSDMSAEAIFEEVKKGGWVVGCISNNRDYVAGSDIWQEFFEKSGSFEPCSVLLAYYYEGSENADAYIVLKEILYDGESYYYAESDSREDAIDKAKSYKYLIKDFYEIYQGPVIGQGLVKAYFLSNDDTWTYREWDHLQKCSRHDPERNYYSDCMTVSVHFELYESSISVPTGEYPLFLDRCEDWHNN